MTGSIDKVRTGPISGYACEYPDLSTHTQILVSLSSQSQAVPDRPKEYVGILLNLC